MKKVTRAALLCLALLTVNTAVLADEGHIPIGGKTTPTKDKEAVTMTAPTITPASLYFWTFFNFGKFF